MPEEKRHDVGETHPERVEREKNHDARVDARAVRTRWKGRIDLVLMAACLVGLLGVVWWQLSADQEAGQKLDLAARAAAFRTSTQVAIQGCEADRRLREQYKIRGRDLRILARMQLADERESLATLDDPSIVETFSPELLATAEERANVAIVKLTKIVNEIRPLKVPACDRLRKRLKQSEGRVLDPP